MVVKKYLDNSPTGWKNILSFHLRKVGGPFLFHCNFELDSLPLDLPVFHRNCLDAWSSINKSSLATSKQIANQILWNNKFIRIEKKTLYNKRLINCNFVTIRDFYDDDGNSIIEQKSRILKISPIDTFLLFQVLSAIPPEWRKKVKEENTLKNFLLSTQSRICSMCNSGRKSLRCLNLSQKNCTKE